MKILKANKIIVFGGGTSGWLTAAYLVKNINFPCKITLIESTEIGIIGVGEGTQPATARFMHDCGFEPKFWMKPSKAAFKLGVEFDGWTKEKYFVDNDFIENTIIGPNLYTSDYFVSKKAKDFFDWLPAYQLAKENKSPKLAGLDINYALQGDRQFGAVHFAASEIVQSVKNLILDKIDYYDTKIVQVNRNEQGITDLQDEQGNIYEADLFIDCTGFKSILLEKSLNVEFESIDHLLPCDSAVAMPKSYTDPEKECHPYTKATAMSAGWRWTIPIYSRIGNGYVYSSKHISKEDAEAELRKSIDENNADALHLKMRCGIHKQVAHLNVVAAGLSAGFVEPLEATGITFTTKAVEVLVRLLNNQNGVWQQPARNAFNKIYQDMFWEIVAFVWAHYKYSTKSDTDFWKDVKKTEINDLPEQVREIIKKFIPIPHRNFFIHPESSFHIGHWFSVLKAGGVYEVENDQIIGDKEKYAKYFLEANTYRINLAKEYFPNHYEFLRNWYEQ